MTREKFNSDEENENWKPSHLLKLAIRKTILLLISRDEKNLHEISLAKITKPTTNKSLAVIRRDTVSLEEKRQ